MSEIWQPSRLTRQQMEERRLAALPLLSDRSVPSRVIAERFGVAPSVIRYWRQRLARGESLVMLQEFLPNLARPFRGSGKLEEYYGKATQNLVT